MITDERCSPFPAEAGQNQIQFINLVIDYLTQSGWMRAAQLYESPFTDFSPKGVEGVFNSEQVGQLVGILDEIRTRAAASNQRRAEP